jgi:hypothetical protein
MMRIDYVPKKREEIIRAMKVAFGKRRQGEKVKYATCFRRFMCEGLCWIFLDSLDTPVHINMSLSSRCAV